MPQPLLKIDPHAGFAFGPHVLIQRPAFASLIAQVVTGWSHVELRQLDLFMDMIGSRNKLAADMFIALQTRGVRNEAVGKIANYRLTRAQLQVFQALLDISRTCAKERDRIAHWLVATPASTRKIPSLENSIVFFSPAAFVLGTKETLQSDILVYTEADMHRIIDRLSMLERCFHSFTRILRNRDATARRQQLAELSREPAIREAKERRASKQKSPPATIP